MKCPDRIGGTGSQEMFLRPRARNAGLRGVLQRRGQAEMQVRPRDDQPKIDFGCAQWCQYAEQCVGAVPDEVKASRGGSKDLLRERIAFEMKRYFGTDYKRVNHALKVARYTEQILKMEGGHPWSSWDPPIYTTSDSRG